MPVSNFLFDVRELKFVLKEWLNMEKLLSCPSYKEHYSIDDIDTIVDKAFKVVRDTVGPICKDSDTIGIRFIDGKVVTPDSFKKAFEIINEAGMGVQYADRESEGHLPFTITRACEEMILGANIGFTTFLGIPAGAIEVIRKHGSNFLKQKFLPKMISGEWGATMNLTEAGAGSDVGASVTKALATQKPGIYGIKGNKVFITVGDHDLQENIIHLVLARIEGAKSGVAGLSLFIVPKYWVNDDGSLGDFNDVTCVGIEEKMGIHSSPTTSLVYGENDSCRGYLIGDPIDTSGKGYGIEQMFTMMNQERLGTGLMALGAASQAYFHACEYAGQRVQGTKFTGSKGPKVCVIE